MKAGCLALVAFLVAPAVACAGLVRIEFTGTFALFRIGFAAEDQALWALIDETVDLSTPFSGSLTFDDSATRVSLEDYRTFFAFPDSTFSLATTFADYEANASGPLDVELWDFPSDSGLSGPGDEFHARAALIAATDAAAASQLRAFHLLLRGTTLGEPLHGNDLSDVPLDLDNFPVSLITWQFGGEPVPGQDPRIPTGVELIGQIHAMTRVPVPEPSAAALSGLCIAALGVVGFRRARS